MKQVKVTTLQFNKFRRKYNDVVRRKLVSAGIKFQELSISYGYRIMVAESDFSEASRIVLSVSHTNPQY